MPVEVWKNKKKVQNTDGVAKGNSIELPKEGL